MPEVSLQSYGEEMRRLVGEGLHDQAIAMGRHVLRVYPKHLQTYRILGEACLEKGNYKEAHKIFARALACDPEDLFSRVGIAVAHEKQGHLDLAIWHLERAYELTPGNAELRKELQRLYAQREGVAPPRLKLTSAAVARLYARSGLWLQAIQEYRTLLQQDPDQVDIKVALAEALWQSGQRKEAVKVCEEILAQYPHCLKANLILGEISLRGERESEGRALLQLAQDIDPENTVAQKLFGDRSPLPARVVKIVPPEAMPAPAAEPEVVITEEEIPAEALADWLEETPLEPLREGGPEPTAPAEAEEIEAAPPAAGWPEAAEAEEAEEGIPDWLRRIRERQKEEAAQPAAPTEEPAEVPDWLARLRQEQAITEAPPAEEITKELPLAEELAEAVPEEGLPDWLTSLAVEAPSAEAPEAVEPTEVEVEALLAEAAAEKPAEIAQAPEEIVAEVETPAEEEVVAAQAEEPTPAEIAQAPEEIVAEVETPAEEETVAAQPEEPAPAEIAQAPEEIVAEVETPAAEEVVAAQPEEPAPAEIAQAPEEVSPERVLAQARERRDAGDADGALDLYERLIREGVMLDKVLADLESGATGPLAQARTYTLIGDLCTKQERLQKALEAYRRALELVKKKI